MDDDYGERHSDVFDHDGFSIHHYDNDCQNISQADRVEYVINIPYSVIFNKAPVGSDRNKNYGSDCNDKWKLNQ